jgi:pimeloyl-ACP methyl ester carboxylesterase
MTTYFISGIATDKRVYDYPLQQIPGSVYLPFPRHEPSDTVESYALKFLPLIDTSRPFNIVGNSMGGIMTMELLRHVQPQKVVLISSVKCRAEMPWRLRQLKYSRLHRLLPGKGFIAGVQYGSLFLKEINRVPGMRELVVQMARNNTPGFLYWCVHAIATWQGGHDYRKDIIHLHGTRDGMFPIRNIANAIAVPGGSHNMQLTRKEEVTSLLRQYLQIS